MDRAQISVGKNGSAVFYLNAKNVHVEPQNSDFILIELYMILSNMILIIHLDSLWFKCKKHANGASEFRLYTYRTIYVTF